jgi:hypothetical protein
VSTETRPAFYALSSGGWRDYVTLLHPPYTLWHLSYVAVGAGLASPFSWTRCLAALVAFALGMGVGAHALDELRGRPLRTRISDRTLWVLAIGGISSATAVGLYACLEWTWWLAPFVGAGAFIAVAYNLELFGGSFHNTLWFALAWGALPALSAYVVEAATLRIEAVAAALYAALLSYAQRILSTQARAARRQEGTVRPELETALLALAAASIAVGAALLAGHV